MSSNSSPRKIKAAGVISWDNSLPAARRRSSSSANSLRTWASVNAGETGKHSVHEREKWICTFARSCIGIYTPLWIFAFLPCDAHQFPFFYKGTTQRVHQTPVALNLAIALSQRRLVSGYQGSSLFHPVSEPKVVIKDIMATARALRFGRVVQAVMASPDTLRCLHV